MTPTDVAALTALVAIIKEIGTWPLITISIFVIAGPWVGMFIITRGQEKRHSEVVNMYEENAKLVKNYETVAKGLQDILVLSTQTMTQVKDRVDNNLYCPLMRKDPKVERTT
ncbi:MAG: hypothetical protein M0T70_02860 [Geobacteraceae bacterium]|nr:hypothetical protein [Geobacteraceae bacterium]